MHPPATTQTQAPLKTSLRNKIIPLKFAYEVKFDLQDVLKLIPNAYHAYKLPELPEDGRYILPVSGGADSSTLAIVLHLLYPSVPFEMVFTDTLAEDPGVYATLNSLERFLNKRITRITPAAGLFELIDQYKGFLPSAQKRYCTRVLKLETFKPWLEQYAGRPKAMFIGIRFDESFRVGFAIDEVISEMPFLDLGVTRPMVFDILERTIGIPSYYRRRTRSGCSNCFFQRRSELVGLLQEEPVEFEKGSQREKIDPINEGAYPPALPLWRDSGISLNWMALPQPKSDDAIQGRKSKSTSLSLFNDRGIFVGAEFFTDGMYANDEFIWHQRVVSYSPTKAGLIRQLDDRYQHLLSTGEVYDMTPDDVRTKVKFAIYYVELPESVFNPDAPKGTSYTWQQGASYEQLKHIVEWTTRALHAESMREQAAMVAPELSVEFEWIESSKAALTKLKQEVGQVVISQWYKASETPAELTVEEEAVQLPCPACSI